MILRFLLVCCIIGILFDVASSQYIWRSKTAEPAIADMEKYSILGYYTLNLESYLTAISNQRSNEIITQLPSKNGDLKDVVLSPYHVFDDGLSAKYKSIKSFKGSFKDSKDWTIFVTTSPYYINVTYRSTSGEFLYIDPVSLDGGEDYILYSVADKQREKFACGVVDDHYTIREDMRLGLGDCKLRKYRLALSCTAEYASFHGGTVEKVLTAYNNSVTRVNSVYEVDLGIQLILIDNVDKLIFFNAITDPFTNNNSEAMLDENQSVVDQIIGNSNYDIGHAFSTSDGGIASLRSVCSGGKAQGVTGNPSPRGDAFDIDYVCHEIGHQFGANHTQNNACQRSSSASYEPGSASTIMGYAGICDPDVQNNSHDYFHNHSLNEIFNFVIAGGGRTCGVVEETSNSAPEASVAKGLYVIPKSTSFFLQASAEDLDGDPLTYCWEQFDREIATMPPVSTSTQGPAFRSVLPTTSPIRYFPDLQKKYGQWEVLPSVGRTMNFKCTVRDNSPLGGCIDEESVSVIVNGTSGPFVVTYPSASGVSWLSGSQKTITWNVANTDMAPISCDKVDVLLSVDNGKTYPFTLLTGMPNTGSADITVPSQITNFAKIMVKSGNNIFFDVSDSAFKIIATFDVSTATEEITICDEDNVSFSVSVMGLNASAPAEVNVDVTNLPSQVTATYTTEPIAVPGNIDIDLSNLTALAPGTYTFQVIVKNGSESHAQEITLFKGIKSASALEFVAPHDGAKVGRNVDLQWEEILGIDGYSVQVSTSKDFDNASTYHSNENALTVSLEENQVYLWRVKGNSPCIDIPYNEPRYFYVGTDTSPVVILHQNTIFVNKDAAYTMSKNDLLITDTLGTSRCFVQKIPTHCTISSGSTVFAKYDEISYSDIIDRKIDIATSAQAGTKDTLTLHILDAKNRWKSFVDVFIHVVDGQTVQYGYREVEPILCAEDSLARVEIFRFGDTSKIMVVDHKDTLQSQFVFLNAGTHIISLLDDDLEEIYQFSIPIISPEPVGLQLMQDYYDMNVLSSGGSGDVLIKVNEGDFENVSVVEDIPNGDYVFTAQDELGCSVSQAITVNVAPLSFEISYDSIKCYNEKTNIYATPTGGFLPYSYALGQLDYQVDSVYTLGAGTYVIFVKDQGGRVVSQDSITLTAPKIMQASALVRRYEAIFNVNGGTPPYMFSIDDITYQSSDTVTFVANGNYKVFIMDNNGCKINRNVSINVFTSINATVRDVTCFGKNDGSVRFVSQNGSAPFNFSFNGSNFTTNRNYTNLTASVYPYKVYDAKGDTVTGEVIVSEPTELTIDVVIESSGFTLQGVGGVSPYTYSIDNGVVFIANNQFASLPDGTYNVAVKDANGCVVSQVIVLTAVEDVNNGGVLLYPNPTFDRCYFSGIDEAQRKDMKIEIYNADGQILLQNIQLGFPYQYIDLSSLPCGMYFLKIKNIDLNAIFKVVKM